MGNVTSLSTTLPTGTDTQVFCYDAQDRLTWAGSTGTPPCGGTPTPGTLSGAQYSASYSYDSLNRLTSGPAGSYTYGDSAHLDAATSTSGGYTATYDASGNMTCRAPTSSTTCAGTPTGAQLAYDNEGRLVSWQNAPTAPTSTDAFLYDGEGNRVLQQSSSGGTTTTTTYVGSLEEVTTSGGTTTTTVYYPGGFAESVNGNISYLASGGLGSPEVALEANGNAEASVLYAPYGTVRYRSGASMPTDLGFTGQHSDASTTGLDYYGARYYDPTLGQFTSADTTLAGGTNRYAYVHGNPETLRDPSGHMECDDAGCDETGGPTGGGGEGGDDSDNANAGITPNFSHELTGDDPLVLDDGAAGPDSIEPDELHQELKSEEEVQTQEANRALDPGQEPHGLQSEEQQAYEQAQAQAQQAAQSSDGTTSDATGNGGQGDSSTGHSGGNSTSGTGNAGTSSQATSTASQQAQQAVDTLSNESNRLHHIFDNPDHNWSVTGLNQDGNLGQIQQVLESNYSQIAQSPEPFDATESFGSYSVTVRSILLNGEIRISTAWVDVIP